MRRGSRNRVVLAFAPLTLLVSAPAVAAEKPALQPSQTIPLTGVEGRFDHFSVDVKKKRLFVAALGNNTVEAIDLAQGRRAGTIRNIPEPTGIRYVSENDRLYVGSGTSSFICFVTGSRATCASAQSPIVQRIPCPIICWKPWFPQVRWSCPHAV